MYRKRESLIGKQYGRLTVVNEGPTHITPKGRKKYSWLCKCNCGNPNLVTIEESNLRWGNTQSCGCIHLEYLEKSRKSNRYVLCGDYYKVYLANGEFFLIDSIDYDLVSKHYWFTDEPHGYIYMSKKNKHVRLHRLLLNDIDENLVVDHINGNRKDNRRCNLRIVSYSQNNNNSKLRSDNTSGVKGVGWDKSRNKWIASIVLNGKKIYLGRYDNKKGAIAARKAAEDKYFGEYSYDNSQAIAEKNKIKD